MKAKEDIRPISYVKANAAEILEQVNETRRPVYVTQNGEARAILLDSKTYEDMRDALALMKLLSQSEKDIQDGNVQSQDEYFAEVEARLSLKNKKEAQV